MTKGNQIRGPFSGDDSRNSRGFQRIALGRLVPANCLDSLRRHDYLRRSDGAPRGGGLVRRVDHFRVAVFVEVGKLTHGFDFKMPCTISVLPPSRTSLDASSPVHRSARFCFGVSLETNLMIATTGQ